jgi:hypothetical protein
MSQFFHRKSSVQRGYGVPRFLTIMFSGSELHFEEKKQPFGIQLLKISANVNNVLGENRLVAQNSCIKN